MNKIISILLGLAGLLTVVVGVYFLTKANSVPPNIRVAFCILFFVDAFCYFVSGWAISTKTKSLLWLVIVLLVINAIGAIFDNIGIYDLIFTAYNILIIILIVFNKKVLFEN